MPIKKFYWKHKSKVLEEKKQYYEKNKEKIKKYYQSWYAKKGRNRSLDYQEVTLKWQEDHPEGVKAHGALRYAIQTGFLKKPELCMKCGRKTRLAGHHRDYKEPLIVIWLCYSCHKLEHNLILDNKQN